MAFPYSGAFAYERKDKKMSWLESIPIIGKIFDNAADIAKEAVTDKDMLNNLLGTLESGKQEITREMYLKELESKTVPWVDALHKMGRQISNWMLVIAVVVLAMLDKDISPAMMMLMGGGNVAYQVIKGKGK